MTWLSCRGWSKLTPMPPGRPRERRVAPSVRARNRRPVLGQRGREDPGAGAGANWTARLPGYRAFSAPFTAAVASRGTRDCPATANPLQGRGMLALSAEGEGFEPSVPGLPAQRFSRPCRSACNPRWELKARIRGNPRGNETQPPRLRNARHRLSRAGNRSLNHALHLAARVQTMHPGPGRTHYQRKQTEHKTPAEALRSLKRQLAKLSSYRHLRADHALQRSPTPQST